jgi:uncharacterized protein YodC (DUF2158 family)
MADQYKPGDVVRLRSGGVPMTVVDLGQHKQTGKPACRCVWMVNGEFREAFINPIGLVRHVAEEGVRSDW